MNAFEYGYRMGAVSGERVPVKDKNYSKIINRNCKIGSEQNKRNTESDKEWLRGYDAALNDIIAAWN